MNAHERIQSFIDQVGLDVKMIEITDDSAVAAARPWDVLVRDPRLYARILRKGSLGFGEAYMDGWWTCANLPELFRRLMAAGLDEVLYRSGWLSFADRARRFFAGILNRQTRARSRTVGEVHYDDRVFNAASLGETMVGTCAYYDRGANTLDTAQDAKLMLICEKLGLQRGQRFLDIGCGWGTLMALAASCFGVRATGVTISKDQLAFARERYGNDGRLRFELCDYRDFKADAPFDRIASVGMFEHVGKKNYPEYFSIVREKLAKDGLFLLHTIVGRRREHATDPFIDKYIFPNGELPTIAELTAAAANAGFRVEDLHNLGFNYARTLYDWTKNFMAKRHEIVREHGERTARMYEYYLGVSEGGFRARALNVVQLVLAPLSRTEPYVSVR